MGIVVGIIIFGIIIAIHEFGHFAAAKTSGVRVNEFAIGMGPQILKKKKGDTTYSLRLLPIGGFCAMEGEDESSDDECALNKKSIGIRFKIMVAGAAMNLILGFVAVLILNIMQPAFITTSIAKFEDNALSSETGLMLNDKILEINGLNIYSDIDLSYALSSDKDGVYDMKVKRDGEKIKLSGVTFAKSEDNIVLDFKVYPQEKNALNVVTTSFKKSFSIGRLVWISLGDLITGNFKMSELSGPVGIVSQINENVKPEPNQTTREVAENIINILAFITINVGIMNLLPFPALDGGKILFLIIEAVRGKPVKPEREGMVHLIGIVILFALMILVTFNDIMNLIRG